MKKNIFTFLIILGVIFLIKPWNWHVHFNKNPKTLAQHLELTKQQIVFEKLMRKENQKEIKPVLEKLEIETKSYKRLVARKADQNVINAEKEVINKLDEKYNDIQKKHMIQFEKILTKEQKDKFKRLRTRLFISE